MTQMNNNVDKRFPFHISSSWIVQLVQMTGYDLGLMEVERD